MNSFEEFLKEQEQEAKTLPANERDARLERISGLWKNYKGEDRIVTFEELAEMMANEPEVKTIKTSFPCLDELTGGFRYEQLIILSAQEKTGKTAFGLQITDDMREEHPVCFLFEQSARELIRQMKSREQPLPRSYTPIETVDNRWEWIQNRMFESMVKYGSRVFLIDNADWLEKEYGSGQRTDEVVRDMLLKLKTFCKQWQVIIILIAHVRKVAFTQIPQPDDIKDTAAFKQIADVVLILWRSTAEETVVGTKTKAIVRTNKTLLWVAENRQMGTVGYAQLVFDGKKFVPSLWDDSLEQSQVTNFHDATLS